MTITDAKKYIRRIIEKSVPVTVAIVGQTGIGKSAIQKQLAKEMAEHFKGPYGFIDLRLATQEPGDLIGLPRSSGISEATLLFAKAVAEAIAKEFSNPLVKGLANCVIRVVDNTMKTLRMETKYSIPDWFPKPGTRGVICLEELNRAPNDVRQCIFQFIWDRQLHQQNLPDGWTIILAMNPETEDGSYQVETLDKALIRRCSVITVEPNVNSWMEWATGPGNVPAEITGFIGTHKDMLFVPEEFNFPIHRTPAGWGDTLSLLRKADAIPQELEYDIVSGILGKEAAVAFIKYMDKQYERPVNGEEVLNDYENVREKVKKQAKKAEEMWVTIKQIIGIAEKSNKKLARKQMENLIEFIEDLPLETAAMLVHDLPSEIVSALVEIDERILKIGKASRTAREEK